MTKPTHLNDAGEVHMVDVGAKDITAREAVAEGNLLMREDVRRALFTGTAAKGDALACARVAAIMAAKRTPELIPLCHSLALDAVTVEIEEVPTPSAARLRVTVRTTGKTGAEMEALTATSMGLLTLYDMLKALQKDMRMTDVRLLKKSGGKSGESAHPIE